MAAHWACSKKKDKRMMPGLIHGPLTGLNSRKLGTILLK